MLKSTILFSLLVLPLAINAAYNKFFFQDLGSKEIRITNVDLVPMPVVQPGEATLTFQGETLRALDGALTTKIDIIRTVAGLALPVRCYIATLPSGDQVSAGSCTYDDLCLVLKTLLPQFNPTDCPPAVLPFGIDCTCPMKLIKGQINIEEILNLPDATAMGFSFLASGDFDVTIITNDTKGPFGSVKIGFTVKAANSGK